MWFRLFTNPTSGMRSPTPFRLGLDGERERADGTREEATDHGSGTSTAEDKLGGIRAGKQSVS